MKVIKQKLWKNIGFLTPSYICMLFWRQTWAHTKLLTWKQYSHSTRDPVLRWKCPLRAWHYFWSFKWKTKKKKSKIKVNANVINEKHDVCRNLCNVLTCICRVSSVLCKNCKRRRFLIDLQEFYSLNTPRPEGHFSLLYHNVKKSIHLSWIFSM